VDLSSSIDSNLVAGGYRQTGVVSGAVVHETFASGGIGLFVDCALERNLLSYSGLEISGIRFIYEKNVRRLSPGGDIGTCSRKAMLYVGAGERFCVECLDVEDDGYDV
jgi:hypothetical protein